MIGILFYIKLYAIALAVFIFLDFLWIAVAMGKFYDREIGSLARRKAKRFSPHLPSAVAVWMLIVLGILLFVFPKADPAGIGIGAFLWGFLFGFILYGVYDLTNYSILENWSFHHDHH